MKNFRSQIFVKWKYGKAKQNQQYRTKVSKGEQKKVECNDSETFQGVPDFIHIPAQNNRKKMELVSPCF